MLSFSHGTCMVSSTGYPVRVTAMMANLNAVADSARAQTKTHFLYFRPEKSTFIKAFQCPSTPSEKYFAEQHVFLPNCLCRLVDHSLLVQTPPLHLLCHHCPKSKYAAKLCFSHRVSQQTLPKRQNESSFSAYFPCKVRSHVAGAPQHCAGPPYSFLPIIAPPVRAISALA